MSQKWARVTYDPLYCSESRIQADTVLHSLSQSMGRVDREEGEEDEEDLYQATKF